MKETKDILIEVKTRKKFQRYLRNERSNSKKNCERERKKDQTKRYLKNKRSNSKRNRERRRKKNEIKIYL